MLGNEVRVEEDKENGEEARECKGRVPMCRREVDEHAQMARAIHQWRWVQGVRS
jgi:hypothetical protein